MAFLKAGSVIHNLNRVRNIALRDNSIHLNLDYHYGIQEPMIFYSRNAEEAKRVFDYILALLVEGVNLIDVDLYLNQK